MEQIIISLDSYNIEEAKADIVKKLIRDNPKITVERAAKELGISLRTLYRFMLKHKDIKFQKREDRILSEANAIALLKEKGYKIKK